MKIAIEWGSPNTLRVEDYAGRPGEMAMASEHLEASCKTRCAELGTDTLTFEVGVTMVMYTLIRNYLPQTFRWLRRPDTDDEILDDHLIYKQSGWSADELEESDDDEEFI